MASPKRAATGYDFPHVDTAGHTVQESLRVDLKGHVTWRRDEELRVFRRSDVVGVSYVTRSSDPDDPKALRLAAAGLFDLMMQRCPVFLALLLSIFNIFTATALMTTALAWTIWQVFPQSAGRYDMSTGPDYRPLTLSSILAFCHICTVALCLYWLEVGTMLLGFKPPQRRRAWLLWSNRVVLGLNAIWSLYVLVLCPIAYSVTWKLDCSNDLCAPGSTGVATCGVNGCTCGGLMDMSCTPAISKVGSLCARVQQPLCQAIGGSGASGAQVPLLLGAFGASAYGALLGLQWLVNMFVIYGSWTLESGEQLRVARERAEVEHHRFTVTLRGKGKMIITLGAEEDPDEVMAMLMPEVDLGDPLFYGENDGASTDVPAADEEIEAAEPQWC